MSEDRVPDSLPESPPETPALDPATDRFHRSPGGVLRLTTADRSHLRVAILRALPLSRPDEFLSVRGDDAEVGLIRRLADWPDDQRQVIADELHRRYFRPVLQQVHELGELGGQYHWDVTTDRGRVKFSTENPRQCAQLLPDGRWIVTDTENNRYEIRSLARMDRHSRRLLLALLG